MSDDKISGGRVELVFSLNGKQATFTEYGNKNTGNTLATMSIVNLGRSNDMLNFVGIASDGKLELITLYPKLGKAIWTTHNDRIAWVDRLALSKSFLMDCTTHKLGN